MASDVEHLFICIWTTWKSVYSGPLPIFNWIVYLPDVEHMSSLYILEIKPLSNISLANMFSYMVSSLFVLVMISLAMRKLFSLMQSHLFIFFLFSLALVDTLAKMLLCGMSEISLPIFSSRTFMVS